jgi:Methyltransferase domain
MTTMSATAGVHRLRVTAATTAPAAMISGPVTRRFRASNRASAHAANARTSGSRPALPVEACSRTRSQGLYRPDQSSRRMASGNGGSNGFQLPKSIGSKWNVTGVDRCVATSWIQNGPPCNQTATRGRYSKRYAEALIARGAEVVSFDGSPALVRLARQRVPGQIDVRVHNNGLPLDWLEDESFDAAVMALVIHHRDDRTAALRELWRELRPGSPLVVSNHHPTSDWLRLAAATLRRSEWRKTGTKAVGASGIGACLSSSSARSSRTRGPSSSGWSSRFRE